MRIGTTNERHRGRAGPFQADDAAPVIVMDGADGRMASPEQLGFRQPQAFGHQGARQTLRPHQAGQTRGRPHQDADRPVLLLTPGTFQKQNRRRHQAGGQDHAGDLERTDQAEGAEPDGPGADAGPPSPPPGEMRPEVHDRRFSGHDVHGRWNRRWHHDGAGT